MSYGQSNPRRDEEYNSRVADDSYASRNTDVQSQNRPDDNTTSYSNNSNGGINEEVRKNFEPSDAPSRHTGEDSSMNTGPIRYESYMPGPGDEPKNDSTSRDITSSRDSDLYEDHDEGAGRGAEPQRYDAGSNHTGNDDFGTGDIGQPMSNGYDSGSAGWARENSVSDDSPGASRGYAGDSSSTSATDTSAVGNSVTSRNDEDDVGRADRSIDTDRRDSGVRSTNDDTRDHKNAGNRDESGRGATASTFEEATTGHIGKHDKSAENIGSVGDNGSSINAPTTSNAPEADNSAYKGGNPTGESTRTSRDDAEEGTDDNNYGRSPYDATIVGRDSQTTSSDGQNLPSQRGSSTLVNDEQGRDATTDTSKTSREDVDNTGASTFDDQPSVNENQTSSEGLQRDRDMTHDTTDQDPSFTTHCDGRSSSIQHSSSALHDDQQGRDAAAAKTSKADLDDNGVPTFDNQTSPESGTRSTSDDTGDHGSYDELMKGAGASEAPSGHTGNKSAENIGSIGGGDFGTDAPASSDNIADESEGREDSSARIGPDDTAKGTATSSLPHGGSNIHLDSHTTSDAQPSSDVDNDGSSPFDDQTSFGKDHLSDDDSQRECDTFSDTTGRGLGSRDDTSNRGGLLHEAPYRGGSSQDQDASSTLNAPTEDVDNTNPDNQNEDNQTGRDTASVTTGQDLGSRKEDTSTTSHGPTTGADQPPDTIGYSGGQEDNKPYGDDRTGAGTGVDHSGYGGYAASTGYHAGGKPGLKEKLRGDMSCCASHTNG
ncbi:hypothetical protein EDD85DRAFT_175550 [Armillaria nabsnona]|nr:hypothetical protein EDD85DRAFT_175550 [Armillaria nabsnona]